MVDVAPFSEGNRDFESLPEGTLKPITYSTHVEIRQNVHKTIKTHTWGLKVIDQISCDGLLLTT